MKDNMHPELLEHNEVVAFVANAYKISPAFGLELHALCTSYFR